MMCTDKTSWFWFIHSGFNLQHEDRDTTEISMWLKFACRVKNFPHGGLGSIWCIAQSPQEASAPMQAEEVYSAAQQITVYVGAPSQWCRAALILFFFPCVSLNLSFFSSLDKWKTNIDSVGIDMAHGGFDGEEFCVECWRYLLSLLQWYTDTLSLNCWSADVTRGLSTSCVGTLV